MSSSKIVRTRYVDLSVNSLATIRRSCKLQDLVSIPSAVDFVSCTVDVFISSTCLVTTLSSTFIFIFFLSHGFRISLIPISSVSKIYLSEGGGLQEHYELFLYILGHLQASLGS